MDQYVVRGLGNNIPFLRSVYRNEQFKSGEICSHCSYVTMYLRLIWLLLNTGQYGTAFIAENYPKGFFGVELNDKETSELIAYAGMIHRQRYYDYFDEVLLV